MATEAAKRALHELTQYLDGAAAQHQNTPNAQLFTKLSQAAQGILLFMSTEPDRIDQSVRAHVANSTSTTRSKNVMEYRIVQNLGKVTGDKTKFRQWNHKLKSALRTVDKAYDDVLEEVEKELNIGTPMDKIEKDIKDRVTDDDYDKLVQDLYGILIDKSEDEAYDKIKSIDTNKGLQAYMVLYKWFTDVSGMGLAEQARRLMHPDPPKDESGLAECIEAWYDKMTRLETHGQDFKMPPVYKMNALKSLMVGRSKDFFEIWETEGNATYDEDFFREVLAKAKDYARRKKLDSAVKQNVQKGSDPMDIGYAGSDFDEQYVQAVGGKGKGCWTCGSPDHIARLCPKGKGKGKASAKGWNPAGGRQTEAQGACHHCGEYGHWARECPYKPQGSTLGDYSHKGGGKGKGKGKWKGKGKSVNECDDYEGDSDMINTGDGEVDQIGEDELEWVQVVKKRRGLNNVDKNLPGERSEIHEVSRDGQWEKICVQVDSGAFDWVTPKSTAAHVAVTQTEASKNGACFSAANGSEIKTYGEKVVTGLVDEGFGMRAKMQVADVKRTLASVMSMNRTGNKVVLDGQNSYVENKKTGRRIRIHIEGNRFVFYLWVKAGYQPRGATQVGAVQPPAPRQTFQPIKVQAGSACSPASRAKSPPIKVPAESVGFSLTRRKPPSAGTPKPANRYAVLAADVDGSASDFSRQDKE